MTDSSYMKPIVPIVENEAQHAALLAAVALTGNPAKARLYARERALLALIRDGENDPALHDELLYVRAAIENILCDEDRVYQGAQRAPGSGVA